MMARYTSSIILFFLLCFLPRQSLALLNTLSLADPAQQKSVGERLNFIAVVELSGDDTIEKSGGEHTWEFVPESTKRWLELGPLLVDRESLKGLPSDSATVAKLSFSAIPSEAGNLSIPAFSVRKVGGTFAYKIEPSLTVQISSVLTKEEHGKPAWTLGLMDFGGYNLFALAILVLLAIVVLYFLTQKIYVYWKKRKKTKVLNAKEEALLALEELRGLAKNKITSLQQWKVFAYKLVEILKTYCEKNYLFQTYDLTDRELIQQLHSYVTQREEAKKLEAILQELDQVRYGTKDLDITASPRLLIDAKNFVEKNYIEREKTTAKGGAK